MKSHIITRYPKKVYDEMMIMVQEAKISNSHNVVLPIFILRTLAEITRIARDHPEINHEKGVSVRMSIHSLEILISEAERVRGIINNIKNVFVPVTFIQFVKLQNLNCQKLMTVMKTE